MLDYREDLLVDMNNLLREWNEHSQKFMDYVEAMADAEEEKNLANQEIRIVRSNLAKKMRRRPEAFKIDKSSVSIMNNMIKEAIDSHPDVIAAERRYFTAVKNEKIIEKAQHAMGSYRKTALERIVDLVLRGYAGPKMKLTPDELLEAKSFKKRKSRQFIREMNVDRKVIKRRKRR